MRSPNNLRTRLTAAVVALALPATALLPTSAGASTDNVNIVGYSVVGPAFTALESAFQQTTAGAGVTFTNSFGASDTQTNNVANGQAADLVNLSYEPNITSLVSAGVVPSNWATQETTIAGVKLSGKSAATTYATPGILTDSVVVFIVRKGNPLNVGTNWLSLTKPVNNKTATVQIVTPNPTTSGSARWNLISAYAAAIGAKYSKSKAIAFVRSIISETVAQPVSGSAAMSAFLAGTGNVLLDYEDDALAAVAKGDAISIVYPTQSIVIENPAALTNTGLNNPGAVAFYKYLFSSAGQTILANLGYRPVLKSVWAATSTKFPGYAAKKLHLITSLNANGWAALNTQFFDPTSGIVTQLEQSLG